MMFKVEGFYCRFRVFEVAEVDKVQVAPVKGRSNSANDARKYKDKDREVLKLYCNRYHTWLSR